MNRQRRTPQNGDGPVTTAKGGTRDPLRDASSKELARLAKKVGNDQVRSLLGQAADKRDALLAFVERRLAEVQRAQHAEQREMTDRRRWHHAVGQGEPGFTLPDPTRWRRTAVLYKRAAEALCAGDLGRGAHLLDQAVAAERAAFATVPHEVPLPASLTAPTAEPDERAFVTDGESCAPTQAPAILQAADDIVRVADRSGLEPVPKTLRPHGWWDAEVEEDSKKAEEKKANGPAGGEAVARAHPTTEPERAPTEDEERQDDRVYDAPEEQRAPARAAPESSPAPGAKRKGRKDDVR